jgi:hypothetical protein
MSRHQVLGLCVCGSVLAALAAYGPLVVFLAALLVVAITITAVIGHRRNPAEPPESGIDWQYRKESINGTLRDIRRDPATGREEIYFHDAGVWALHRLGRRPN